MSLSWIKVRLSYERENIKDLADELGTQVARIYKWCTAERNSITPKSSVKPQDSQEVNELRKKN